MLLAPTATEENVNDVWERVTRGAVPVPERLTLWVAGLALSVMVMEPLREPMAVGVKVTVMVQEALGARLEPQVLVWEKSPLTAMLVMVRLAVPVFVSVTL